MDEHTINTEFAGFIPVLTTAAGSCLTSANWQEANVQTVSFHLMSLLLKPGYEVLKSLADLSAYTGWQHPYVLNATFPAVSRDGIYKFRSPYDGSHVSYTVNEILDLINHLQPALVILPQGIDTATTLQSLPSAILPFIPFNERAESPGVRPHGVYFNDDNNASLDSFLEYLAQHSHLPGYVAGNLSLPLMLELSSKGISYLESDQPAADACLEHVYTNEGVISLLDINYATQFEPIDNECTCPTCAQQLTRAYLHHLLVQTPLLCQRFLIQHNIHFTGTELRKMKLRLTSFTPA